MRSSCDGHGDVDVVMVGAVEALAACAPNLESIDLLTTRRVCKNRLAPTPVTRPVKENVCPRDACVVMSKPSTVEVSAISESQPGCSPKMQAHKATANKGSVVLTTCTNEPVRSASEMFVQIVPSRKLYGRVCILRDGR